MFFDYYDFYFFIYLFSCILVPSNCIHEYLTNCFIFPFRSPNSETTSTLLSNGQHENNTMLHAALTSTFCEGIVTIFMQHSHFFPKNRSFNSTSTTMIMCWSNVIRSFGKIEDRNFNFQAKIEHDLFQPLVFFQQFLMVIGSFLLFFLISSRLHHLFSSVFPS